MNFEITNHIKIKDYEENIIIISLYDCRMAMCVCRRTGVVRHRAGEARQHIRVDKNAVPTGLLAEYGFHLAQLDSYNGIPTDSNYVSRMTWEMLYAGLYDSQTRCRNPGLQV